MSQRSEISEMNDEDFIESPFGIVATMDPIDMEQLRWGRRAEANRRQREIPTLRWLAKELRMDPKELSEVLTLVRDGDAYRVRYKLKSNGKPRKICIPSKSLMEVQKRINASILQFLFPRARKTAVFGFSGGSIVEAIEPHLSNTAMLCVDFVDAFPSIDFKQVRDFFTTGRKVWMTGRPLRIANIEHGWFSWYGAMILSELMTYEKKLPQGAPTSPRLFDLLCEEIDKRLLKLAVNVGGTYTRYADNVFFSLPQDEFPRPLRQAILKIIDNRQFSSTFRHKHHRAGPAFQWHKLRIFKIRGNAARKILGFNVIEGKIYNTRDFKRRMRLSVHHCTWLLKHGMEDTQEFEIAWRKLKGQIEFARKDTLSPKLVQAYSLLQEQIA